MRSIRRVRDDWAGVIAKLALLSVMAAAAPVHAESGRLYAGEANGAGMPVTRDGGTDPGALPGDAALAAQSGSLDPQRIYGGLRLNDAVAVEAAQKLPFGDASKPADQALSLAGKARLPLTDGLSVLGKVGVQYSGSILSSGGVGRGDPTPVYGLGLAYEAARGLELRVESEHIAARAGEPKTVTGDSVLLDARLRF
jgi:OmpA-like transmembrane domain